jgi:hypothetical protein
MFKGERIGARLHALWGPRLLKNGAKGTEPKMTAFSDLNYRFSVTFNLI